MYSCLDCVFRTLPWSARLMTIFRNGQVIHQSNDVLPFTKRFDLRDCIFQLADKSRIKPLHKRIRPLFDSHVGANEKRSELLRHRHKICLVHKEEMDLSFPKVTLFHEWLFQSTDENLYDQKRTLRLQEIPTWLEASQRTDVRNCADDHSWLFREKLHK